MAMPVEGTNTPAWTFGGDPVGELVKVHAPGVSSVDEVARAMGVQRREVLKTRLFRTHTNGPALSSAVDPAWVVAVVRGDCEIDPAKLAAGLLEFFHVNLVDEASIPPDPGLKSAYFGPHVVTRKADAVLVVDFEAAQEGAWVTGSNETDYLVKNFNWFRECGDRLADPRRTAVTDISLTKR